MWLIVDPRTPDMAAAGVPREPVREAGFIVWDAAGTAATTSPATASCSRRWGRCWACGRSGPLSVIASAALFARLWRALYGSAARVGRGVVRAGGARGRVGGRIAFALGVRFALGAVLALRRGRPLAGGDRWRRCAPACSPVAGALLGLVGLTHALAERSPRSLLVLGAPAVVVVGALALLFPEGGYEPYPLLSFLATVAVVAASWWRCRRATALRVGGLVYLAACVACLVVHSPMGSNIERYAVLLAGPLLLCALRSSRRAALGACARVGGAVGIAVWTVWGPVRETVAVAGNDLDERRLLRAGERFLEPHSASSDARGGAADTRPLGDGAGWRPRSRWRGAGTSSWTSASTGCCSQKASRRAHTAAWLHREAVAYVALPDARSDPSSEQEGD